MIDQISWAFLDKPNKVLNIATIRPQGIMGSPFLVVEIFIELLRDSLDGLLIHRPLFYNFQ